MRVAEGSQRLGIANRMPSAMSAPDLELTRLERRSLQNFLGNGKPAPCAEHLQAFEDAARRSEAWPLQRWRNLFSDSRKRARRRCLCRATLLLPGGQQPARVAFDDRCFQTRVSLAHYRGAAVLLLRPAGPQGQAAR